MVGARMTAASASLRAFAVSKGSSRLVQIKSTSVKVEDSKFKIPPKGSPVRCTWPSCDCI
eukprot:scaffold194797_cov18-Prasinocladus_malaysianus.AAC.1